MIEIIPSILVKTKEELVEKIKAVEPYVQRIHLDIGDGIFVPSTTIGLSEFEQIETNIETEVHLMVSNPENQAVSWAQTKATTFIFHIEATENLQEVINKFREAEKSVGVALNPKTPTNEIANIVDLVDFVHFMTVEPGFYGSSFEDSVLDKISDFHYFYPDKSIQVDGGINLQTAPKLIQAGAKTLISGSYIFENGNIEEAINSLKNV